MSEPQSDTLVRVVRDAHGQTWHVYVVLERSKWASGVELHRRPWLCLETADERRFISPVPAGWETWSEDRLRTAIASARPDLRGP